MTLATRSTADWQALDAAHHLHPFSDTQSLNQTGSRVVVKGDGVYIWDSEGNRIIDGMAGLWCVNLGYGREELADAAYQQMRELPFYNTFFKTTHPPVIELSALLAELTPPQFNHVFLTNSGSEANDTVIRMVRHFWAAQGQASKKVLIGRWNGYHGSTIGGASLGGMRYMHEQGDLPIPGIEHIEQPYWYVNGGELSPHDYGLKAAQALEAKILALGAENVAAFVGEPIQGAGGVIVPPDSYWPEIQRICRAYNILLVVDEVICGFGRTGHWFGSQHFGIEPDLMPIAKGLSSGYQPIGGVMVSDRVAQVLIQEGGDFNHGMTYSGHPVAAAVALANLKILRDEGIVDQVRDKTGPYLQQKWRETFAGHPYLDDVRGVGFLAAFTWVKDKSRRELFAEPGTVGTICRDIFFKNNIIMRAVGDSMVCAPPLVMTTTEIDEMIALAARCVDLTVQALEARGLV